MIHELFVQNKQKGLLRCYYKPSPHGAPYLRIMEVAGQGEGDVKDLLSKACKILLKSQKAVDIP